MDIDADTLLQLMLDANQCEQTDELIKAFETLGFDLGDNGEHGLEALRAQSWWSTVRDCLWKATHKAPFCARKIDCAPVFTIVIQYIVTFVAEEAGFAAFWEALKRDCEMYPSYVDEGSRVATESFFLSAGCCTREESRELQGLRRLASRMEGRYAIMEYVLQNHTPKGLSYCMRNDFMVTVMNFGRWDADTVLGWLIQVGDATFTT